MKKSKIPKTNNPFKILKMISREEEFERNGGGQWIAKDRPYKNKKKYNRRDQKKGIRQELMPFSFLKKFNLIFFVSYSKKLYICNII